MEISSVEAVVSSGGRSGFLHPAKDNKQTNTKADTNSVFMGRPPVLISVVSNSLIIAYFFRNVKGAVEFFKLTTLLVGDDLPGVPFDEGRRGRYPLLWDFGVDRSEMQRKAAHMVIHMRRRKASGILHDDRAYAFADVLAGVGAGFEAFKDLSVGDNGQDVVVATGQCAHRGKIQLVALLLGIV